jgi:hypothetical protein
MTVFEKSRLLTGMLLLAGVVADAQADVNAIDSHAVTNDEAALTSGGIKNTNWGKVVAPVYDNKYQDFRLELYKPNYLI